MHRPHRLHLAACGLALAAGCVEPSSGTPSSADLDRFDVDPSLDVTVDEDGFAPDNVTVEANSTITVTNTGLDPHGLLEPGTRPDGRIETGDLVPGESVDVHLAEAGRIELEDPRGPGVLIVEVDRAAPTG